MFYLFKLEINLKRKIYRKNFQVKRPYVKISLFLCNKLYQLLLKNLTFQFNCQINHLS